MNLKRFAVPALALLLGASGLSAAKAYGAPQGPGYEHDHGDWDRPPSEWNEFQQRGFHDGIEGARKDVENHRRPNVNNRDEYRHPKVPHDMLKAYREGFQRGYDRAMSHLMGEHEHH